jgi:hypothetical protein
LAAVWARKASRRRQPCRLVLSYLLAALAPSLYVTTDIKIVIRSVGAQTCLNFRMKSLSFSRVYLTSCAFGLSQSHGGSIAMPSLSFTERAPESIMWFEVPHMIQDLQAMLMMVRLVRVFLHCVIGMPCLPLTSAK